MPLMTTIITSTCYTNSLIKITHSKRNYSTIFYRKLTVYLANFCKVKVVTTTMWALFICHIPTI